MFSTAKLTAAQRKVRTMRRTAGSVFYVAAGATVVANVYASQHTVLGAAAGLWTPVAFFMALELIERMPAHKDKRVTWARRMAIGVLALIAGWESYWHLVHVFTAAGADGVGRYAMPLTVDVLMAIARSAMKTNKAAAAPSRPSSRRKPSTSTNVRELKPKAKAI